MIELYRDHFQNYKQYHIKKAQLLIADIPYNVGTDAYASNRNWYVDGDNRKGDSEKAGKQFFETDKDFRIAEFFHFCSKLLKKEPKEKSKAPCMIVFCSFVQQFTLIEYAKKFGFNNYINLIFRKNYSVQVLKANMRIVNNCEYGMLFYREKLPKFNNNGKMIFNCFDFIKDKKLKKIHPKKKPINLLTKLIQIFTDEDDVVIDPVAGSGSTLVASYLTGRNAYGFEINRKFYEDAKIWLKNAQSQPTLFRKKDKNVQSKLFLKKMETKDDV